MAALWFALPPEVLGQRGVAVDTKALAWRTVDLDASSAEADQEKEEEEEDCPLNTSDAAYDLTCVASVER